MMVYYCPYCDKYGMEWDGRAKVLMCVFNDCRRTIPMEGCEFIPSPEEIEKVLRVESKPDSLLNTNQLAFGI